MVFEIDIPAELSMPPLNSGYRYTPGDTLLAQQKASIFPYSRFIYREVDDSSFEENLPRQFFSVQYRIRDLRICCNIFEINPIADRICVLSDLSVVMIFMVVFRTHLLRHDCVALLTKANSSGVSPLKFLITSGVCAAPGLMPRPAGSDS